MAIESSRLTDVAESAHFGRFTAKRNLKHFKKKKCPFATVENGEITTITLKCLGFYIYLYCGFKTKVLNPDT